MASVTDLFKSGGTAEQFLIWNVLSQLLGGALAPAISDIAQGANSVDPVVPLTPQELAVAAARGIIDDGSAPGEAAKSGIGAGRFAQLLALAESPPALSIILQQYQRSLGQVGPGLDQEIDIDAALADLGIAERYRPVVKAAALVQPSAAEVLDAWLKGQIDDGEAVARITATGLDPSWIQTAYDANGQAPTPVQALDMLNRGLIPESGTGPDSISYQQAFLEGPWRNKWLPVFEGLRYYLTPPRSVVAQLRSGAITEARATALLNQNGLDAQTAAEFLAEASHSTTVAQRELTQAQIVDAYEFGLLTQAEAHDDLVAAKFSSSDATLILALADKKKAIAASKSAITRLQTLYLAGTNSAATTRSSLESLGITDAQVTTLLATWDLEKVTATKTLTAGEIVAAVFYDGMSQATGHARLMALGFDATDASILIFNRLHGYPKDWVVV